MTAPANHHLTVTNRNDKTIRGTVVYTRRMVEGSAPNGANTILISPVADAQAA